MSIKISLISGHQGLEAKHLPRPFIFVCVCVSFWSRELELRKYNTGWDKKKEKV